MGTRHEIKIIVDGETKVCQYGQWDGYPTGQGAGIAEFLQKYIVGNSENLEKLKNNVRKIHTLTDKEIEELDKTDWQTSHPQLHRDTGAGILNLILNKNATEFVYSNEEDNRRWCEYYYIINLDTETVQKSQTGRGGKKYKFEDWTPELMERLK